VRRALAVVLAVVTWSGAALAAVPSPQSQIAHIESMTSQIRGLKPLHSVKVSLLGNAAFDRTYTTYVRGLTSDAAIELARREGVLLGELGSKDNLKKILLQGSVGQFAGFYDYQTTTLYVRNNGGSALGVDRHTIAHEYTHALQDQHYHLAALLPDQYPLSYRNSDMVAAHHALTEGDAVTTEIQYIRQTYSRKELSALLKEESKAAPGTPLPKVLNRDLYFPYTTGLAFVQRLFTVKGEESVDAAYRRLPSSTYEIMYPSAYLKHWQPVEITLHGVQGFSDWQQFDDDVFGAEGYNDLLWQHLGTKRADAITMNYRGDRYIFLEKGTDDAIRMDSVWTTAAAARAARDGLISAFKLRFKYPHTSHAGTVWTVRAATVSAALLANGDRLSAAYAPTATLAAQLVTAPTT
jgi:hypothetical protein